MLAQGGGNGCGGARCTVGGATYLWSNLFLQHRVGIRLGDGPSSGPTAATLKPPSLHAPIVSDTGELTYSFENRTLVVSSSSAAIFMGSTAASTEVSGWRGDWALGSGFDLAWGASRDDYGVFTLTVLEPADASLLGAKRILATATTWAENRGMAWANRSAGLLQKGGWGGAPVVVGTPQLRLRAPAAWAVATAVALAPDGSPLPGCAASMMPVASSGLVLNAEPRCATLWWQLAKH